MGEAVNGMRVVRQVVIGGSITWRSQSLLCCLVAVAMWQINEQTILRLLENYGIKLTPASRLSFIVLCLNKPDIMFLYSYLHEKAGWYQPTN